jgi:multicomponent Na+:H+ antiporter subunit B
VSRWVVLFIFAYAACLVLTGHTSPGGAFAGGVAIGLLVPLFFAAFGLQVAERRISTSTAHLGRIGGLLGFLTLGAIALVLGRGFLENFLPKVSGHLTMAGIIILLMISIGILVGYEISLILYYMLGRRPKEERR